MMDEEIRQALTEVREMKQMCGNINMKLTNIVTQRGQNWKEKLKAEYQRGLEDGKEYGLDESDMREAVSYQRGLDDAWEAARKLFSSMADSDIEKAFPTEWNNGGFNALINLQPQKAIAKLKAYEEKQKADDKIEVGDEVNWLGDCFIVTRIYQPRNMKEQCDGIDDDGCVYHDVLIKDLEKTGRHFDIKSILEAMKA